MSGSTRSRSRSPPLCGATLWPPKIVREFTLHHFQNHTTRVDGLRIDVDLPGGTKGYWYNPEDASIVKIVDIAAGMNELEVPPFTIDLALLVTPDGPLDIDHDGRPNHLDTDDDNDGTADDQDAFPLDPSEWADRDRDAIGDNLDADDDGDGMPDDDNKNGTPDYKEMDWDGDRVNRAEVIPWDAFPLDAKEWRDTDGDGIGDNADPDDDNDGFSDVQERQAGTDPLDPLRFPRE